MSDKKKTKDVTVDETQKSTETVVKKEDILEIGHTLQKLKEMHEAVECLIQSHFCGVCL
jgi:hypoxanthine-guanine phosphoribosyltransferase